MFGSIGAAELFLILIVALFLVWPTWRIFRKAGFPPAISFAVLIPGAIFFLYLFLAFAEWPSHRRERLARA